MKLNTPCCTRYLSPRPRRLLHWTSSALACCWCAMKVIVVGTEITPNKFEASEWLTQVNKSREFRTSTGTTIPPTSDTQDGRFLSHKTSNATNDDTTATDRSLTLRQRGRRLVLNSVASNQPRLPSDALKFIVCPRGGILLSKITNFQLLEAIYAAANFPKASICGEDLIQVNPKQNTFAYYTPAIKRAERVLRLMIDNSQYKISVYCAPDESQRCDVIRGIYLRLDRQGKTRSNISAKVNASPSLQQVCFTDTTLAKDASALPSSQRNTLVWWRPAQTPRVCSEDIIIVLKPRTTLDIWKVFRHGDTGTAISGYIIAVTAGDLNVWPVWNKMCWCALSLIRRVADQLIKDFDLRVGEASYPFRSHLKINEEVCRSVISVREDETSESLKS
ncbi:hypothetical protein HPB51_002643 [Rhipicephalus microplus]|uniref:Uncharacterized protein n=1 Tax=Rhipicephalus microplus TaxID=6941 RepID=A0A9J6DFJ3_RHIMP|nr:hypothetical protein HPB51_002643 [Rhipicephalus microplus]